MRATLAEAARLEPLSRVAKASRKSSSKKMDEEKGFP
jgi:hypothetical protein